MKKIEDLRNFVMNGETDEAVSVAKELLNTDVSVKDVVDELAEVMKEVGDKFEKFEVFLPELVVAAEAFLAVMEVFEPKLLETKVEGEEAATVVLGTVKGDFHEIGKTIVSLVLSANGVNVIDLGTDVDAQTFLREAEKNNAQFVGMSALMTSTMPGQQEFIQLLKDKGLRDSYKVIIGGAPTSQAWADDIGADGWSFDAFGTVELVKKLS